MKERQLAEINANVCPILENQQVMLAKLDQLPTKKIPPRTRCPKSKQLSKEEKRKRKELKKKRTQKEITGIPHGTGSDGGTGYTLVQLLSERVQKIAFSNQSDR